MRYNAVLAIIFAILVAMVLANNEHIENKVRAKRGGYGGPSFGGFGGHHVTYGHGHGFGHDGFGHGHGFGHGGFGHGHGGFGHGGFGHGHGYGGYPVPVFHG